MTAFEKPEKNEWVRPIRRGYKLGCCDCGLVHDMDFKVSAGRVWFRVRRNNRSTAMMRRHKGLWKKRDGIYTTTRPTDAR